MQNFSLRRSAFKQSNISDIYNKLVDIADYWSNFRYGQGVPLFDALVRGESLNSGLRHLALRN